MSSTSQVTDFSDLVRDLSNRIRVQTSQTATDTILKRLLNIALFDIHMGGGVQYKLPWAERSAILRTHAPYTTGTVTITQGSTSLTGASTAWDTNNAFSESNMRAGGKILVAGSVDVYEVSSVDSDTSATITTRFVGDDVSAETYSYFEDEYDLHADFLKPVDVQYFDSNRQIVMTNRREFRQRHIRNSTTGKILECMIVDRAFSGSTTPRRRVVFFRPPDAAYLLPYNFITNKLAVSSVGIEKTQMVDDTDEPIVPLYARHIIVLHALAAWYRDMKNDPRYSVAMQEYNSALVRIFADQEIGAARPAMQPRIGSYRAAAQRPFNSGRRSRYTLGTAFDELRD